MWSRRSLSPYRYMVWFVCMCFVCNCRISTHQCIEYRDKCLSINSCMSTLQELPVTPPFIIILCPISGQLQVSIITDQGREASLDDFRLQLALGLQIERWIESVYKISAGGSGGKLNKWHISSRCYSSSLRLLTAGSSVQCKRNYYERDCLFWY